MNYIVMILTTMRVQSVRCVLIAEIVNNMAVDQRDKDGLVAILNEADTAGLTSVLQHREVTIRYQIAMDEFISCTDILLRSGYFNKREYGLASMEHAAKKTRNFISRYAQQPKTI